MQDETKTGSLKERYSKVRPRVKQLLNRAGGPKPGGMRKVGLVAAEEEIEAKKTAQQELMLEKGQTEKAQRQAEERRKAIERTQAELVLERTKTTEAEEKAEKFKELSLTDALTGIPNRRRFIEDLERTLSFAQRYGENFALLYIDLDSMKQINDKYGHSVGDAYIKNATKILHEVLRESDIYGRLGGDEFGVILPQTTEIAAGVIAERIRAAFEQRHLKMMLELVSEATPLTISIGYTTYPHIGKSAEELLVEADAALYISKKPNDGEKGRNRVTHYTGEVPTEFRTTVSEPEKP